MFKVPVFIDTVFKLVLLELHKAYQHFPCGRLGYT